MLEYLEELLESKYNYKLKQKKICKAPEKKNKIILPSSIIFGVVLILYILQLAGVINSFFNLFVLLGSFIVFIVLPIYFGPKQSKYAALVLTPKYLIQVVGKREFVVVEFDKISKYLKTKSGEIVITQNGKKVVIEKECYVSTLPVLNDILEAKGKTFDKSKNYMIRPIEIVINNDEVIIRDIEIVTKTDQIFEKYYKEYKMLTPGFVKDILFRNAVVNEVEIDESELVLKLDHFEVNPGHPENTKFDSIIVEDCVLIFENVGIESVSKIDTHEKEAVVTNLPAELDSFVDEIESGIIAEWTVKDKLFYCKFAAGVYLFEVKITYNEVLCGWNKVR